MSQQIPNAVCIKLHGYLHTHNHNHYCCPCYCLLYTPITQRFYLPINFHIISIAPHAIRTLCAHCHRPISIIRPLATCSTCIRNTRCVQKISNLWSAKIHLFIYKTLTRISFKVVPLVMHTLLPAVPPLLKTLLERICRNGVQLGRRIPHNILSWFKSGPFQRNF